MSPVAQADSLRWSFYHLLSVWKKVGQAVSPVGSQAISLRHVHLRLGSAQIS
jgi:hypothetical protein